MAIALRSTSSATLSAAGTSITVNAPAGLTAGDVMYAVLGSDSKREAISAPTGWVADQALDVGIPEIYTFYKVATSTEPTSYTFTIAASKSLFIVIADYTGVNNTTPLNVGSAPDGGASATPGFASITTTVAGCQILECLCVADTASDTFTPPSGYVLEVSSAYGLDGQVYIADMNQSAAGATGALSGTLSTSNAWQSVTAALNPASTSVTGTLSYTNQNDASSISGKTGVQGTQATQNASDTLASAGKIGVIGTLIYTNAPDTANIAGLVNVYAGTLAYQNALDLLAGSAKIGVQGTVSDTNKNDPATVTGTYSINGRLISVMNNSTMSASGGIGVGGALRSVMLPDTLSSAGKIGIGGLLAAVNAADAMIAQGVFQAQWQPISPAQGTWTASVPASGAWQPISRAPGTWTKIGKI